MKFSYVLPDPGSYESWDDFERDLSHMRQAGYEAVELQVSDPADLDTERLRESLSKYQYDLCAVQTGATYYTQGNCLCTADAGIRERTVELLKRFVDFARDFSSLIVFGSLQGRTCDEPDSGAGADRIIEAVKTVGECATAQGVVLAYEPVNHLETAYHNTITEVAALVREMSLDGVKMMIDTFHMNIEEKSMIECLSGISDILAHVHLSETNRDILGMGHWDTKGFLQALDDMNYDGYCSIGVYNTQLSRERCIRECMEAIKNT